MGLYEEAKSGSGCLHKVKFCLQMPIYKQQGWKGCRGYENHGGWDRRDNRLSVCADGLFLIYRGDKRGVRLRYPAVLVVNICGLRV